MSCVLMETNRHLLFVEHHNGAMADEREQHLPLLLARMASIMVKRASRAPPGISDEILRWATHEGKLCATAFISTWRMLAGVSHFVATSMVGREELAREAAAQAGICQTCVSGGGKHREGES